MARLVAKDSTGGMLPAAPHTHAPTAKKPVARLEKENTLSLSLASYNLLSDM